MTIDSAVQRKIMGQFATGVTVASTQLKNGETWGMTANAVTSLSLDPPLVLLAVVRDSESHQQFSEGNCFVLNILSADQQQLSDRFAYAGPKDFSGLDVTSATTGAPILKGVLGWVDCRVKEVLPGGDHDIFIGEIVAGELGEGEPLLFFGGKYASINLDSNE